MYVIFTAVGVYVNKANVLLFLVYNCNLKTICNTVLIFLQNKALGIIQ